MFLITDVYASAASQQQQPSIMGSVAFLLFFMVVFYFLVWRPQSKRAAQHRSLIANLNVGDEIITSGGILGKISSIGDSYIKVEISSESSISVQKSYISSVIPKGTIKSI